MYFVLTSLIDTRGIVEPETLVQNQPTVNGTAVAVNRVTADECNAVNVRHDNYGTTSTTSPHQNVLSDDQSPSDEPPGYHTGVIKSNGVYHG
ncbi:hypothetical protein LSH36_164g05017 [Paralvinella palmiformis]|uniref:Uncharacterized protein n=1 Tax=Paralvinella palmiformis TaxID=53620 RepID=A0AAD9JT64_9ANNE|nr:hypothetical protein LSH36_164g05017 [Paralvinella palmiformis]